MNAYSGTENNVMAKSEVTNRTEELNTSSMCSIPIIINFGPIVVIALGSILHRYPFWRNPLKIEQRCIVEISQRSGCIEAIAA